MVRFEGINLFKVLIIAIFLGVFVCFFLPFYAELLLAAIFAFAVEPMLGKWFRPRHVKWRLSVAMILAAMFVVVTAPLAIVGYKIYALAVQISKTGLQQSEVYLRLAELKHELVSFASRVIDRLGLSSQVDLAGISEEVLMTILNKGVNIATNLAGQVPQILLSVFIFVAALYFFLAEAAFLRQVFLRQKLLTLSETERFLNVIQKACHATVVSSVIIGIIQALIVSIGALVFGIGDFTIIFVVTFFCSFVPIIGAGPVALVLAGYQLLLGETGSAIGLLIVAAIAGTTDNLARPYLLSSNEEDLHPIIGLFAIIGALMLFGMPGLLLGPVIASVAVKIIPTLFEERA